MSLFDQKYPNTPGYKRRATAKKAAREVKDKAPTIRDQCFAVLKAAYPKALTADEVAARVGKTPFTVRPRITELFASGLIMDTGLTRKNDSGKDAVCWSVVPNGKN